jgi:hypothetical protein
MRRHYAVALFAAILVGFTVKLFFFSAAPAEAETRNSLDISRMHVGKDLPVQNLHDMSFVFSQEH